MPFIERFTRFVERLLPETRSPLTRSLDPAALENPIVAVEAVRRTIALAMEAMCPKVEAAVAAGEKIGGLSLAEPVEALRQARDFISDVSGPPDSDNEDRRLTSTLHALDHVSRLAEAAGEEPEFPMTHDGEDEARAAVLCIEAMRSAAAAVGDIAQESALSADAAPIRSMETPGAEAALARLEENARLLEQLKQGHRGPTLSKVAAGEIKVEQAMARIETVRRLEALARHAWRAVAHLLGSAKAPLA
jgi:phosphate:Na+ symporter